MDYVPWPEDGCTLAEARLRTIEGAHCRQSSELGDEPIPAPQCDQPIEALLAKRQLIAYGCISESDACESVTADLWASLSIDWGASTARNEAATILSVRVFPILKAPCCLTFLDEVPLAEAFHAFILNDPEVARLAARAIQESPEQERTFKEGRCHPYGDEFWPPRRGACLASSLPLEARKDDFGSILHDNTPDSVLSAADALRDRFDALFDLLRDGRLQARGITMADGIERPIPRAIWSHRDFYVSSAGDVLQTNPESENPPYDFYVGRWTGVMLARRAASETNNVGTSTTPIRKQQSLASSDAARIEPRQQGTAKAISECVAWLESEMTKSPSMRIGKKQDWWVKAKAKFGPRLSERGFQRAWDLAVQASGALAWSKAGAPHKNPRT